MVVPRWPMYAFGPQVHAQTTMITDRDIEAFIECVDKASQSPLELNGETSADIQARVHATVCPGERSMNDMHVLGRTIFRRAQLQPRLRVYAAYARHLTHFTSSEKTFCDFSEIDRWCEAIQYLDLLQRQPGYLFDPDRTVGMERDIAVTSAIARLQQEGYRFSLKYERIEFVEGELDRCAQDLFDDFRKVDGFRISYLLLRHLQKNNRFKGGRYLTGRISRPLAEANPKPAPPLGYLLNLAAANLSVERVQNCTDEAVQKIFTKAADIVAALDVETYNPYAHMYSSHDRLPINLREMFIADHALSFRQIRPTDALEIMNGLFDWVDNDIVRSKMGWSLDDLFTLMRWIFVCVSPEAINATLSRKSLGRSGIPEDRLRKLLEDISHNPSGINREYRAPDATKANMSTKPLIVTSDGRYFLFSLSISAIGFYEVAASTLRSVFGSRADQYIGDAIEPFVARMFGRRRIEPSVQSKKYSMHGVRGECDLIVETDRAILLIELKKKSMTRAAQAGDSYSGFFDLFGGVLSAQEQLGQHELVLRRYGYLEFEDGAQVRLKNRGVERLAVTLLDWGGTQDSMVLRGIAPVLIGSSLNYPNATEDQIKQLAKVNRTLSALGTQQAELLELGVEPRDLHTNWSFMSVPQLMALLNGVHNADSFYTALRSVRSVHTGSLDFYQELAWWPDTALSGPAIDTETLESE
ncbi:hypothetical protein [Burkholderia ubonensis]|uniref:hypothetical protein n=2 Tax=Burkholderia ubonensis TaxID=101571 RepID=UPI000A854971|nr:hypothetical protein [Burkholderia ubonensis]